MSTENFFKYQCEAQASVNEDELQRREVCPHCPPDEIYENEEGGIRPYRSFWHLTKNDWVECVYPPEYWVERLHIQ